MDNSEQLQKINERLQSALEKQVETIESATDNLISGINSDNSKFVDELDTIKGNILSSVQKATSGGNLDLEIDKTISLSSLMGDMSKLDNLNFALAFKFLKVKRNILKSVENATNGGNLDLEIDKNISLSELLGESPNLNLVHAFRWLRIKKNILKKVEAATEGVELEIDPKMSLNDVLGSTPDQDIITKTRFFMIRQGLLKKISKAAKNFDPQQTVDNITGGLGGAPAASAEGIPAESAESITPGAPEGATSSVIPPEALEAITKTSSSLESLVESSEVDVLQARENRKEDIARDGERTDALSNLTGGKNVVAAGKEKTGGMINTVKDGIKSKLGFGGGAGRAGGGAGKAAGGGIGGAIAGVGKGVGEGISGFMKSLGKGLKALADKKYLISAAVLIALGGALFITGKALKEFVGLDFKSIAIGVVTLGALAVMAKLIGKAAKEIFIGSLAIAALGASLIPAGFAFGMFSDINWAGVGIGIGVLVALGAAAFGLSFIAPAIFIGAAAIAVLGAALIPAAFAFDIFGTALQKITPFFTVFADAISTVIGAVGDFLTNFVESLSKLGDAGPGLLIAAAGIAAVSAALIAFGAAAAVGGVMSFFSGDPVKKFIELGEVAPDLATASDSIDKLSDSIQAFDTGEPDKLEEFVDQIKRLSKLKLKTVAKVMQHISEISGAASAPANVLPAGSAIGGMPATPQLEQKNTPSSKEIEDDGVVTKEYIESVLAKEKASKAYDDFLDDKSKSFKTVEKVDSGPLGDTFYTERVYDNEEDQAMADSLLQKRQDAIRTTQSEKRKIIGGDIGKFAQDQGLQRTGRENQRTRRSVDSFLQDKVDKVKEQQMEAPKPAKTIPDQMGEIVKATTASAKVVPLDSPVAQSTSPQLEQKNTPRSVEIKDDGVATKEYIEAKIAHDKAYAESKAFENDKSKKFSMVEETDEWDDIVEVRKYDNAEDQAMFEKLQAATEDTAWDVHDEKRKIVGIESGDNFEQQNAKNAQFLDANVEKSKRKWIGDSSMANSINVDGFLQEAVERYKNKEMEASKPQSNSVEQIEKQSGNQLDMASRQNEADKNASKNGDGQTLNNVVNNKEGDTTQVSNTTINNQPHIDRTADYLAPAF